MFANNPYSWITAGCTAEILDRIAGGITPKEKCMAHADNIGCVVGMAALYPDNVISDIVMLRIPNFAQSKFGVGFAIMEQMNAIVANCNSRPLSSATSRCDYSRFLCEIASRINPDYFPLDYRYAQNLRQQADFLAGKYQWFETPMLGLKYLLPVPPDYVKGCAISIQVASVILTLVSLIENHPVSLPYVRWRRFIFSLGAPYTTAKEAGDIIDINIQQIAAACNQKHIVNFIPPVSADVKNEIIPENINTTVVNSQNSEEAGCQKQEQTMNDTFPRLKLLALLENGSKKAKELSQALGMTVSDTMKGILALAITDGYVERTEQYKNHPKQAYRLTEAGKQVLMEKRE